MEDICLYTCSTGQASVRGRPAVINDFLPFHATSPSCSIRAEFCRCPLIFGSYSWSSVICSHRSDLAWGLHVIFVLWGPGGEDPFFSFYLYPTFLARTQKSLAPLLLEAHQEDASPGTYAGTPKRLGVPRNIFILPSLGSPLEIIHFQTMKEPTLLSSNVVWLPHVHCGWPLRFVFLCFFFSSSLEASRIFPVCLVFCNPDRCNTRPGWGSFFIPAAGHWLGLLFRPGKIPCICFDNIFLLCFFSFGFGFICFSGTSCSYDTCCSSFLPHFPVPLPLLKIWEMFLTHFLSRLLNVLSVISRKLFPLLDCFFPSLLFLCYVWGDFLNSSEDPDGHLSYFLLISVLLPSQLIFKLIAYVRFIKINIFTVNF